MKAQVIRRNINLPKLLFLINVKARVEFYLVKIKNAYKYIR